MAWILGLLWMVAVCGGMGVLTQYAGTAGLQSPAPGEWPSDSQIPHDGRQPTLVMFVHPGCPCSKASIAELERLMGEFEGELKAHVVLFNPAGSQEGCCHAEMRDLAKGMRGVVAWNDDSGRETRLFHAETSGHTIVYDRDRTLVFQGGVTISRGHRGDSPGMDALRAQLDRKVATPVQAAVFGCALFDKNPQTKALPCTRS